VQDIVVGNKTFTDVAKPSEIVSLLLNDDELANLGNNPSLQQLESSEAALKKLPTTTSRRQDLWNEEGDDFDNGADAAGMNDDDGFEASPVKGKRKDTGPSKRGRKPGRPKKVHVEDMDE
jgi:chromatin-remodeling ATPase INO80